MNRQLFLRASVATVATAGMLAARRTAAAAATTPITYDAFLALARAQYRHKQLFTAPRANNGAIFTYIRNSLNGYQFGWSEGPGTLHAAAVLNGLGVVQGVGDSSWQSYRLAEVAAAAGDPARGSDTAARNPWLHAPSAFPRNDVDVNAPFNQDVSIETLQRRGATIFVCDVALLTLAMRVVKFGSAGGAGVEAVHTALRADIVPGSLLVPAGVTTIDALQQEHFTLYDASV